MIVANDTCRNVRDAAIFVLIALCSACETESEDIVRAASAHCRVNIGAATLFVGDVDCLSELPMREMQGFWVVGHEYSVLYRDKQSIQLTYDRRATWLELSERAYSVVSKFVSEDQIKVFEVRFVGSRAEGPGVYGGTGDFMGAALMDKVLSIEEVSTK